MRSPIPFLTRVGQWLAVLLPLVLTHGRGLAEADLDALAVLMLLRSAGTRDWTQGSWTWTREPWIAATFLWWGWQALCTLWDDAGGGVFTQSLLAIRFPLAAASLGCWLLRDPVWRRRVFLTACLCGAYIAFQMLIQATFGRNLFGIPRFGDGTLTGPYTHPRAAAPLSRLIPPMLMLACVWISRWKSRTARAAGLCAATVLAVAVMILAGQRIPFALTLLGIAVCALLYRPMRPAAVLALVSVPVLLLAARVFSPGSFRHLVLLAREQLGHFGASSYGRIFAHALEMGRARPLTGWGYDGYRHHCADWGADFPGPGGDLARLCAQHPHNHYLQALVNAGVPGLLLFCIMIACWLKALFPRRGGSPLAIGLFASVLMQEWPVASSSDFLNLPLGGWGFLLLGLGLSYRGLACRGFEDSPARPIS